MAEQRMRQLLNRLEIAHVFGTNYRWHRLPEYAMHMDTQELEREYDRADEALMHLRDMYDEAVDPTEREQIRQVMSNARWYRRLIDERLIAWMRWNDQRHARMG